MTSPDAQLSGAIEPRWPTTRQQQRKRHGLGLGLRLVVLCLGPECQHLRREGAGKSVSFVIVCYLIDFHF